MSENRAPGTVWCLRRDALDTYVRTIIGDRVQIVGPDGGTYLASIVLSRKDARLLAKRINQCLAATAKR